MADENKPAFYPRVGNIKAKNFKPAKPMPFIDDPRAMELPRFGEDSDQFGMVDVGVPSQQNLELGRRMVERENQLRRQREADRSPLEKAAGALQTVRLMGSALTQAINSLPTRIAKGDAAAEQFMQDRMYKPEQPLAYEYAGDVGEFLDRLETQYKLPPILPEAVALQYLSAPATSQAMRTAGRGAEQTGRAIERRMEPVVKGALERGGLPREMVLAMGANTQSNVIKPKGGNWLGGDVEKALDPLITKGIIANREIPYGPEFDAAIVQRIADLKDTASMPGYTGGAGRVAKMLEDDLQDAVSTQNRVKDAAINKWVQSNLTNYVKKEMGTPEDPVRKLAEQDISHLPQDLQNIEMTWTPEELAKTRKRFGFPEEETATNPTAKMWEQMADEMIAPSRATEFGEKARQQNPWLEKLNPYDTVYETMRGMPQALKFDHIIDVLREDIAAGRIRPEQLNKVSMEQAVRRTYEYDQELARKMNEARATSREGLPVFKDYPEGYKWVQLTRPGDFAAESQAMGHSVKGYEPPQNSPDWTEGSGDSGSSGYGLGGWNAIKRGDAKIYSLIDSKGEPHVTIEVGKAPQSARGYYDLPVDIQDEIRDTSMDAVRSTDDPRLWDRNENLSDYGYQKLEAIKDQMARDWLKNNPQNTPDRIVQIKGKQNAKPKEDYLPFVQDFVRGGNWSDVRDFQNTGFDWQATGPKGIFDPKDIQTLEQAGYKVPKYLTNAEKEELTRKWYELDSGNDYDTGLPKEPPTPDIPPDVLPDVPPDLEGMKRGGVVISNNPDTMMLELGNKRMKEGGSEDDTKPYFGGAGTKKYAAAKKRAEQGDVNTLKDPRTYAAVSGLMGERPDEMGFSVLHPDYQAIKDVAEPAFGLGIAAQAYPLIGPLTKGLPVGASIKNVTPMKASEALGMIEGRPLKITQSDRTKVGGGFLGGPGFSGLQLTEPEYRAAEAAWGVQNAGTAKTILGGGKKGDNAVYAAMIGTPTQHQSNQMVFDKLYGDFKKAAKRGELTPELRDLINTRLAASVDKKGNPVFPADVDIMDKKFRDIANTFSRRSIAGHLMGGVQVGGKKGQIIDYDKIIRNTTDPALIDQPTGALGNRLFTLSGGIVDRPDLHPAFPAILQGEDLGVMFTPVERNLVMKDFVDKTMREKGRKPGYMDYTRGNPPTQLITEDILTELQKLGLKKGGAVKQPAAYIDGNEFVEAAQKYGIRDSMNNLNMIVNLVNKGLTVDDAARQVADSGMHKAEGGEVSGDDLILEERPL